MDMAQVLVLPREGNAEKLRACTNNAQGGASGAHCIRKRGKF
jgi:hypothetical protein